MKRTVDEKYEYNKKRMFQPLPTTSVAEREQAGRQRSFAAGYCMGVALYQGYPSADPKNRQRRVKAIDGAKVKAKTGDLYCKGMLCGVRDAADERKARK